jgi:hypothetical protein
LRELGNRINEAHQEKSEVILTVWQKESVQGKITRLDGKTQTVHVESGFETVKVKFIDILKIDNAPSTEARCYAFHKI